MLYMLPYLPRIVSTVCCPIDCTGCLGHLEEGSQAQCISRTACLAAVVAGASPVPKRQIWQCGVRDQKIWT